MVATMGGLACRSLIWAGHTTCNRPRPRPVRAHSGRAGHLRSPEVRYMALRAFPFGTWARMEICSVREAVFPHLTPERPRSRKSRHPFVNLYERVRSHSSSRQTRYLCRCPTTRRCDNGAPRSWTFEATSAAGVAPRSCRLHPSLQRSGLPGYQSTSCTVAASPTRDANSFGSWVPPSRPR